MIIMEEPIDYSTTSDDKVSNSYSNMLLNGIQNQDIEVQDIPLIINTVDMSYPLAFIDYEESNVLGINYTSEDGTERFVVINKKYIVDVEILYQQDIDIFTAEDISDEIENNTMYQ